MQFCKNYVYFSLNSAKFIYFKYLPLNLLYLYELFDETVVFYYYLYTIIHTYIEFVNNFLYIYNKLRYKNQFSENLCLHNIYI